MSRAVLSVGSNLGDRAAHLRRAASYFSPWTVARSPIYETPPWGPVPQGDFLNAVVVVDDAAADAEHWLLRAQHCEQRAERIHDVRYGPRTLDVDVIAVDDVVSAEPLLQLPHPRAAERAFVLVPWVAVDPAAELLGAGPVAALLQRLPATDVEGVRRRRDLSWTD